MRHLHFIRPAGAMENPANGEPDGVRNPYSGETVARAGGL